MYAKLFSVCSRLNSFQLSWVSCSANRAAHVLAQLGASVDGHVDWIDDAPLEIMNILSNEFQ